MPPHRLIRHWVRNIENTLESTGPPSPIVYCGSQLVPFLLDLSRLGEILETLVWAAILLSAAAGGLSSGLAAAGAAGTAAAGAAAGRVVAGGVAAAGTTSGGAAAGRAAAGRAAAVEAAAGRVAAVGAVTGAL